MARVPGLYRRLEIMAHPIQSKLLLLVVVLFTACNGRQDDPADRAIADGAPPIADRAGAGANGNADAAGQPVCLQQPTFVADGAVPLEPARDGNAASISDLRWERHEGCERFVIDLVGPDGQPASATGDVGAELLRGLGVVRLRLREVEAVEPDATEARFDGPLARAAYAVWSPEGRWVYVDLHLADPAEASVLALSDPARVVVDLRPGGGPLPAAPAVDRRVVVLRPRAGQAAYPLTVTGYARTFEANVVARLEQSGEVVREEFTTATAWADAWGHYSITLPDGPAGRVTLHVGEHSARDGTWEGAAVELEMR